ncbi:purple acid phosphatase 22-like protein [Carex littledalei]|uniref:Purple acid phosphatase 22-like protein n=1 Tax=Carex littledalei TaxID=544730 RepID=A0A833V0G0_9POAL|nr:purple acid phosphatase 22-like protein [Carex littledalei]
MLMKRFNANHKYAKFSLFREASFGHGRLQVIDGKNASWSWHRNDDSGATVRDEVQLESHSSSSACHHDKTKIKDEL